MLQQFAGSAWPDIKNVYTSKKTFLTAIFWKAYFDWTSGHQRHVRNNDVLLQESCIKLMVYEYD
jgi:hypothetical protein